MSKDRFLKEFTKSHRGEVEEVTKIQEILNQIKDTEKSKVQYFVQFKFSIQ